MAQLDLFAQLHEEIQVQQKEIITEAVSNKLYHTITEVAKIYNVNASLLRFWETEFPQIKLRKTNRGDRLYTQEDIQLIGTIHYLTKEKKITLEGTRAYLKNNKKAATNERNLVEELKALKKFLQSLKATIA